MVNTNCSPHIDLSASGVELAGRDREIAAKYCDEIISNVDAVRLGDKYSERDVK
jgi:hypothetical protein